MRASETDEVKKLEALWTQATTTRGRSRANLAWGEDQRYNRWIGQSTDGRRHAKDLPSGEKVWPWEGYPDCRLFLADETIRQLVDVGVVALASAAVRVTPAHLSKLTAEETSELRAMVQWMVNGPLAAELEAAAELAESTKETHGVVIYFTDWEQVIMNKRVTVSLAELLALATGGDAGSPEGGARPGTPPEPKIAWPNQGVVVTEAGAADGVAALDAEAVATLLQAAYGVTKRSRAVALAKELLATGQAEVPRPQVVRNGPVVKVLRPLEDVVWPADTHVLRPHEAEWYQVRERVTELRLKELGREREWPDAWIETALKQKSRPESLDDQTAGPLNAATLTDPAENQRIELRWHYAWELDEDEVRVLRCRVYVPGVKGFAEEYYLDAVTDQFPFTVDQTEVTHPQLGQARGVPDVMGTWEGQVKSFFDDVQGRLQITLNPPMTYKARSLDGVRRETPAPPVGPGATIDTRIYGDAAFLPIGSSDAAAASNLIQYYAMRVASYYGLPHADLPPILSQVKTQRRVGRTLRAWSSVLFQLTVLAYQRLKPDELEEIIGRPPVLSAERLGEFRVALRFNAATMDRDWLLEMLKTVSTVLIPQDRGGAFDASKYVSIYMSLLDPVFGTEIATEAEGASQRIYREVLATVVSMQSGNEAEYVQNDPTASTKLQFLAQILQQNPKALSALAGDPQSGLQLIQQFPQSLEQYDPAKAPDPVFAMRLTKYVEHLVFTAQQMGPNKETGRLGVKTGGGL